MLLRQNDYSPLTPPRLGAWTPSLPVSVVIPARNAPHLDLVLAALAAQTYPAHLLEVLVVDDGGDPPPRLPEIRPANTRIVPAGPGWGISCAVNAGVRQADGEIIQRLDADMVACREHIEALARWHHVADYVVGIGMKKFVEPPALTPARVRAAGSLGELFDLESAVPSSTEATIAKTDGLRRSRNPYHVCTGPTVSLRREVFHAVGGLDPAVLRGEDTEFAYRLAMHGVVFVPDPQAQAVHLGLPAQHRDRDRAVRAVEPYLAHRVPLRRDLRKERGRSWLVPYIEIVYEVAGVPAETVRQAVSAALDGKLHDVVVTLVGPWSKLGEERRPVLDDPDFELRRLRDLYLHDQRVRLIDEAAPTPAPIPFRYRGPVEVPLHRVTLERMVETIQEDLSGVLVVELPEGRAARLERTSALGRALLLGSTDLDADLDGTIEATHGVRHASPDRYWPPASPPKQPAKPREPQPAVRIAEPAPGLLGRLRSALRQN
ncbi:glycosyltransferase [Thermoactinospora rubra]|uniref:glycosyltransferase n=1 Tax=Thermoactinospora rubra TaxID=1088767 RepID=UPI000A0FE388|nr:glycosyltransferase [Thermoactinospora rubra]